MSDDTPQTGRREALKSLARVAGLGAGAAGLSVWLASRSRRPEEPPSLSLTTHFAVPRNPAFPELAVVKGSDPRSIVRRAVQELGGMGRFISRGDVVVIKPNAAWDRTPAQAANTNPDILGETARLCFEAGAKKVIIADVSINEPRRVLLRSGIGAAASAAGAEVVLPEQNHFKNVDLRGEVLGIWPVLDAFLEADKMINLPAAKHHSLTGATLGIKNWYGILGGQRSRLHQRIHESLADLADFMRPTLTIIDAYRVLLRNGPGGGNLSDVALHQTVVAATDPVAADAYAASVFWSLDAASMPYLRMAAARGLGTPEFQRLGSRFVTL